MATIPMGSFGQAVPGPAAQVSIPRGDPIGQAADRTGQIAQGVTNDMQAQQTKLDMEAKQAAERARTITTLTSTKDKLSDLHDQIATGVIDGTVPKEQAEAEFSKQSAKLLEGLGTDLPDHTRQVVMAELNGDAMRLGNNVRKSVAQRDRMDVTAGISQTLEYLQRQYKTDPGKVTQQAMDAVDALGPHSTLSPDQLAKIKQTWKEGTQYTTAFELVHNARNDRKQLDAAERTLADANALPDLDPQKRAQLQDRAQAYRFHLDQQAELAAQRAQREAERRLRLAEAEFNTFQSMADKGTVLDPTYIDRAMQATAGTPYQKGIAALVKQATDTGGLAAQPVQVQRAALDAIDAYIAQHGRTPELDARRTQVEKVLKGSEQDLARDPLRAGLKRGVISQLVPLNMQGGIAGVVQQISDRVVQADRVQQWAGRPVSPLTEQEWESLGQMLKTLPADQRAGAVATLAATMPPKQAQALAGQIDKHDRPLAIALGLGAARTTFDRPTSELVLKGAEALKNKTIKEEKMAVDGWQGRIAKATEAVFSNPEQAQMTGEAARYILAGLVAEGASGSDGDVRQAVRLAVGGTLAEINGSRIVLPAGVERQAFDKHLRSYPEPALAAQLPDGKVYVRGHPMEAAQFLASLPSAKLQTVGRGRYVVQAGGTIAANARNQPIVIEVPDAR